MRTFVLAGAAVAAAAAALLTTGAAAAAESPEVAASRLSANFYPCHDHFDSTRGPLLSECLDSTGARPQPFVTATCDQLGTSTIQMSFSDRLPDGRMWWEYLEVKIGPQFHAPDPTDFPLAWSGTPSESIGFPVGAVQQVTGSFTIETSGGTVTGRTRLPISPDLANYGVCRTFDGEPTDSSVFGAAPTTGFFYILNLGVLEYEATAPGGSDYLYGGLSGAYLMNTFATDEPATFVKSASGHFRHGFADGDARGHVMTDADGDGVEDGIDDPLFTAAWRDEVASPLAGRGPVNLGRVASMTEPLKMTLTDLVDPYGVWITVGASANPGAGAWFHACGGTSNLFVGAGSAVESYCGSTGANVHAGSALLAVGGGLATVALGAGDGAKVTENADGTFTVSEVQGTVTVTVDGVSTTVAEGSTLTGAAWDFQGFAKPVDNGGVLNVAKAGRAIPLKWRLLDAQGQPVTNLAGATMTVKSLSCDLGATQDAVEEFAAGSSGLQNLGNGYYQLNWQTPSSYAGSCKTLKLSVGDGVTHDALFKFTK